MNQKINMDGLLTPQQQQDIDYNLIKNRLFRDDVLVGVFKDNAKKYPQVNSSEDDLTLVDIDYLTLVAGENLSNGDAIIVGDGTSSYLTSQYVDGNNETYDARRGGDFNDRFFAQGFTATGNKVTKASIKISAYTASSSGTIYIYTVNGGQPQTALGSKTFGVASGINWNEVTFDTAISVTAGNTYAVVVQISDGGSYKYWLGSSGNPYSTGKAYNYNLTDGWSEIVDYDFDFKVYEIITEAGKAYKANASEAGDKTNNFIGFATADATSGNNVSIKINGIVTLSNLTAGEIYYLSNTAGNISTSPGSVSKKVGIAISSTQLLIKDN